MVLELEALQSNGSIAPQPGHAISLPARPRSAPAAIDSAVPDVCRQSQPGCDLQMSGFGQTTGQSAGGTHPSSSAPTSAPSGSPSTRSVVFASPATLLLLTQGLVCCIDRLNPPPKADMWIVAHLRHWAHFPTPFVANEQPASTHKVDMTRRRAVALSRAHLPCQAVRAKCVAYEVIARYRNTQWPRRWNDRASQRFDRCRPTWR